MEGSVYRFRVSSSNNSGDDQFSTPIEIKTLRTNPPAIENAPAVKIEAKEAIINWKQSKLNDIPWYHGSMVKMINFDFRSNAKRSSI